MSEPRYVMRLSLNVLDNVVMPSYNRSCGSRPRTAPNRCRSKRPRQHDAVWRAAALCQQCGPSGVNLRESKLLDNRLGLRKPCRLIRIAREGRELPHPRRDSGCGDDCTRLPYPRVVETSTRVWAW